MKQVVFTCQISLDWKIQFHIVLNDSSQLFCLWNLAFHTDMLNYLWVFLYVKALVSEFCWFIGTTIDRSCRLPIETLRADIPLYRLTMSQFRLFNGHFRICAIKEKCITCTGTLTDRQFQEFVWKH